MLKTITSYALAAFLIPVAVCSAGDFATFQFSNGGSGSSSYYGGGYSGGYSYPPVAVSLSVSCAPTSVVASPNEPVTWFSSVTGGGGPYTYFWSGTDGISGNTSSIRVSYANGGPKVATLTAVSAGQSVTANCSSPITVGPNQAVPMNRLSVSCYAAQARIAPGESGTWLSTITGLPATGDVVYQWSGSDDLTGFGPSAFKTYTANGEKFALLTVMTSTGRAVTACTKSIVVGPRIASSAITSSLPAKSAEAPLQGVCKASTEKSETGVEVLWRAAVVGGSGEYRYLWTGDEALSGDASTTAKTYEEPGTKHAEVTVISGSAALTLSCLPDVEVIKGQNGLMAAVFNAFTSTAFFLIMGIIIAIILGILFAVRKRRQEEEEEADKGAKH